MLKILIEEEYGYRYWIWTHPGTKEELLTDWNKGEAPLDFFNPRNSSFKGSLEQIQTPEVIRGAWKEVEGGSYLYAHVHEPGDTFIEIDGIRHPESFVNRDF